MVIAVANKYKKYLLNKEFDELFQKAFDSDIALRKAIWEAHTAHLRLIYRAHETGCMGDKDLESAHDVLDRIDDCTDEARILYVPLYNRTLEKVEKKLGEGDRP